MRKSNTHTGTSPCILILNAGSSSIKFAAFLADDNLTRLTEGQVERIGTPHATFTAQTTGAAAATRWSIRAGSHASAAAHVLKWMQVAIEGQQMVAVGHRIVFGGPKLIHHQRITAAVLKELQRDSSLDPSHLPRDIALIRAVRNEYPLLPQYACFDTAFHHAMPQEARILPIPWTYYKQGIQKLGFHGISYEYIVATLRRIAPAQARGRVVIAHLGSGCSLAAVRNGKPVDTTMGFTPAGGLVMASRTGDMDPGVLLYLMEHEKLTPRAMEQWITEQCGLRGVSQRSGDMRDLLQTQKTDPRAAAAVALFCHRARQWIAAMAASMGGIDTLIFSGGIGQHAWQIRQEICRGLKFLDIDLDIRANRDRASVISTPHSRVAVRIIPTDEQIQLARIVRGLLPVRLPASKNPTRQATDVFEL